MNKFGIMQGRILPKTLEKLQIFPEKWEKEIEIISSIGFGYIELLDDKKGVFRELIKKNKTPFFNKLNANNLKCNSICADYLCDFSLLNNKNAFMKELDDLINYISPLSDLIIVIPFFDKNTIETTNECKSCIERLSIYDKILKKKKLNFSLEIDLSAEEIYNVAKNFELSNIGLCYDLGNNIGKGRSLSKEIVLLNRLINHIHIKDKVNNENIRIREKNPIMESAFRALKEIEYDKVMIFETSITPIPLEEAEMNLVTIKNYIDMIK